MSKQGVLYAAFDAYPGLKGAQAHIRTNLKALTESGAPVALLCLGKGKPFRDPGSCAVVYPCDTAEPNFLRRSEIFARFVAEVADSMLPDPPTVIHFRDIWSGVPLLAHPLSLRARTLFEVNGLPSVELPDHFPRLTGNTGLLARLRCLEEECLARVNRVVTVSKRTLRYLTDRGVKAAKITVIPNAADPPAGKVADVATDGLDRGGKIILYAGTLAPWQGVDTLVLAMGRLRHRSDIRLVLAAPGRKGVDRVRKMIATQGLGGSVTILTGVRQGEMHSLYAGAYLSVAPLTRGPRNELQGCSPVKVVESMACGTPVVASDLPVVRELMRHGEEGWLVPPDSSRALAAALDALTANEGMRRQLATAAGERARREFGTELFAARLNAVYRELTGG